jgi:hypothetical protein
MLKAVETVLVVLLAVGIYGGVPALMLWGWHDGSDERNREPYL